MANILPPQAAKRIRTEYRSRFLLIGSLAIFVYSLAISIALFPPALSLILATPPSSAPQSSSTEAKTDLATVKRVQGELTVLGSIASTSTLDTLITALSLKGAGISILSISYSTTGKTISMSGKAETPDELNTFRSALQSNALFKNVSVPVGALLGQQGGTFTMTVSLN